jgi:hypothetical protein
MEKASGHPADILSISNVGPSLAETETSKFQSRRRLIIGAGLRREREGDEAGRQGFSMSRGAWSKGMAIFDSDLSRKHFSTLCRGYAGAGNSVEAKSG